MYGELMRIEGLTARVYELWEENRWVGVYRADGTEYIVERIT